MSMLANSLVTEFKFSGMIQNDGWIHQMISRLNTAKTVPIFILHVQFHFYCINKETTTEGSP